MEYSVKVIDSDLRVFEAHIKIIDESDGVTIILKCLDGFEMCEKDTFPFVCFCKIRVILEAKGLKLCCKGSRKDVYPSGRMLVGFNAYLLRKGKQASSTDILNIFEDETDFLSLSTVADQENYYREWLVSL